MRIEAEEKQLHQVETDSVEKPKMKGRITGFLAAALTILYAVYIVSYFGDASADLGGAIAAALVMPHMICVVIAAVFSLVGFFVKKRWGMLVAGILMAVSAALMPMYAMMVIVQAVLFFISYARMGKA